MNKLQAEIDYRRQVMQIEALINKKKALQPLYDLSHHDDYEDGEEQTTQKEQIDVIKLCREDVQKELELYVQGIKRRLTMNVNKRVDPILDVFDMLQLQEVHLRTKSIN